MQQRQRKTLIQHFLIWAKRRYLSHIKVSYGTTIIFLLLCFLNLAESLPGLVKHQEEKTNFKYSEH